METHLAAAVAAVETKLDVEFRDKLLLVQALTHRSYLNERPRHPTGHNERLEFLGDAIIEMIVTEMLFLKYPEGTEGNLSGYRAALVSAQALGPISEELGLHNSMFFSKGEARNIVSDAKSRNYQCCCVFEAIVGALYRDQGLGACRMLIDCFLWRKQSTMLKSWEDHKSLFQEEAQARFGRTPHYKVISETGPDHMHTYHMACLLGDVKVSEGTGPSKNDAMKAAAKTARETTTQWEGRIAGVERQTTPALRRSGSRSQR